MIKLWSCQCNILLEGFCCLHWDSCFLNVILFKKLFEFRGGNTMIKTLQTCFSFRCSCLRNFCVWWSLFVSCSRIFSLSTFSFFNLNFDSHKLDNIFGYLMPDNFITRDKIISFRFLHAYYGTRLITYKLFSSRWW